ncbi:MAG: hypothetical protein BWY52_01309 [Chloroflexi bacterium ADurb.Bin325]|nr:MAG: hypothetical protein BWY52_01309 [Chloroflexi bacterium ADurb.Bin325]
MSVENAALSQTLTGEKTPTKAGRAPIWLWGGVVMAFLARLAIAWSPVKISFALSVPDDAYYYFTIARNIAAGVGVSFDGLAPTNGFHPLWMLVNTLVWRLVGASQTLPVHIALTVGAIFDLVTMAGIWRLASALTRRSYLAGIAVLVYAWNPYNLAASVNGLETSLGAMLFVWSLVVYWRLRLASRVTWQSWLTIGGLWSLLLLARTDYLIIIFPCAIDLVWRQRRDLGQIWAATLGALVWLPWLAWNKVTFGSFSQVSGKAYPYYLQTLWQAEGHTFQQWLVQEARMAYGILANLAVLSGFGKVIILLALVSAALLLAAWASRGRTSTGCQSDWSQLSGLLWPTLGALALLMIHGLIRWMYIPWYFVPMSILTVLWFSAFLSWLDSKRRTWAQALGVVVILLQVGQVATVLQKGGMWPEQASTVDSFMASVSCEKEETIGISDSGYYGYYLPCRVVNLDGVVNNQAFLAIKERRFRRYLDEIGLNKVYLNDIIASVVTLNEGAVPLAPPYSTEH